MDQNDIEKEENKQAKLRFIEAFFKGMEQRVVFLDELFRNKHRDEALLLCCCYIEGLGSYYYFPDKGNRWNFVRILKEYGDEELFWHIHPTQLQRELANDRHSHVRRIGKKLDVLLTKAERKLFSENEILDLVKSVIDTKELETLTQKLWRGTFAAIAYERIRNEAVHKLGAVNVSFQNTTFKGKPVPNLDFLLLYRPLQQILKAIKEISLKSQNWFGNASIL